MITYITPPPATVMVKPLTKMGTSNGTQLNDTINQSWEKQIRATFSIFGRQRAKALQELTRFSLPQHYKMYL